MKLRRSETQATPENHPKRLLARGIVASGLVSIALLSSGCSFLSKEQPKLTGPQPAEIENDLREIFDPAMASLGKKAARFARLHPDEVFWYKPMKNQYSLSISGKEDFGIDITKKKGVSKDRFRPGDVEEIVLRSSYVRPGIVEPAREQSSEQRFMLGDKDERVPCNRGVNAESSFFEGTFGELSAFETVDKCLAQTSGFGPYNMEISYIHGAQQIVRDMNAGFDALVESIKQ